MTIGRYAILPVADAPGEFRVLDGGVELCILPMPWGRMIERHHASLLAADDALAAEMLLHGIVLHREMMAALGAFAARRNGTLPAGKGDVVPGPWPGEPR